MTNECGIVDCVTTERIYTWFIAARVEVLAHVTVKTFGTRALESIRRLFTDSKVLTRAEIHQKLICDPKKCSNVFLISLSQEVTSFFDCNCRSRDGFGCSCFTFHNCNT